jgi:hypothetical protein
LKPPVGGCNGNKEKGQPHRRLTLRRRTDELYSVLDANANGLPTIAVLPADDDIMLKFLK